MEPIKVTIPTRIAQILEKDAELFSILKPSGTINKNKLYNLIIKNYQSLFRSQHEESIFDITSILEEFNLNDEEELIHKLSKYIEEKQMLKEDNDENSIIRILINQSTSGIYEEFIDNYLDAYSSVSECLRRLFCSYASNPLNIREQIIFKEASDTIKKAIRNKKQIKLKQRGKKKIVHPYALVTSKEELYNYLLCKEIDTDGTTNQPKEKCISFRLTHLSDVSIQDAYAEFSDYDLECLKETNLLSPQYIVRSPNPLVKVLLNDEGIKQLDRIYSQRPKCIEKNGHIYTFACTEDQAKVYFSKFKRNAIVIDPESLAEKLQKDFYVAQKTYKIYLEKGIEPCKTYMGIEKKKL